MNRDSSVPGSAEPDNKSGSGDSASILARIEARTGKSTRILLHDPQDESSPPIRPKSAEVGAQAGRYFTRPWGEQAGSSRRPGCAGQGGWF